MIYRSNGLQNDRPNLHRVSFAKLKEMRLKQETLMASLGIAYDPEEYKKLSILNHRINAATERRRAK